MGTRRIDLVITVLVVATGLTWWIGERGAAGGPVMAAVLGIAGIKCLLVILDFMGLRGVSRLWQALVVGWTAVVLLLIAAAYQ